MGRPPLGFAIRTRVGPKRIAATVDRRKIGPRTQRGWSLMPRRVNRTFAAAIVTAQLAGCGGSSDEAGGTGLAGTVVDAASNAPLPGALIVIEEGGAYRPNPDPSKGNPSYRYGTRGGADGSFR